MLELVNTLKRASKSIDICNYLITLWDVKDILIALRKRGIVVRIIVDSKNNDEKKKENQAQFLQKASIRVKTNPVFMMHNKFVIVDNQVALLGSTNLTLNAFYENDETLVKTRQPVIVQAFRDQFNFMWGEMPEYRQTDVRIDMDNSRSS